MCVCGILQLRLRFQEAKTVLESSLAFFFDTFDEHVARRDIVNKTDDLTGSPDAKLGVTIDKDLLAALSTNEGGDLCKFARLALLLDLESLEGDLVLVETTRVAPATQEEGSIRFLGLDNLFLDVLVDGGLDGAHEPGTHVDATSAEDKRSSETEAVSEASRGDKGDLEGLAGAAEQDEVCNVAFAHVASTLEAVNRQEINAQLHGALCVSDSRAFMEDDDAGFLQLRNHGARRVACRLYNLDPFVDDRLRVRAVVGGHHGGQ